MNTNFFIKPEKNTLIRDEREEEENREYKKKWGSRKKKRGKWGITDGRDPLVIIDGCLLRNNY